MRELLFGRTNWRINERRGATSPHEHLPRERTAAPLFRAFVLARPQIVVDRASLDEDETRLFGARDGGAKPVRRARVDREVLGLDRLDQRWVVRATRLLCHSSNKGSLCLPSE